MVFEKLQTAPPPPSDKAILPTMQKMKLQIYIYVQKNK